MGSPSRQEVDEGRRRLPVSVTYDTARTGRGEEVAQNTPPESRGVRHCVSMGPGHESSMLCSAIWAVFILRFAVVGRSCQFDCRFL